MDLSIEGETVVRVCFDEALTFLTDGGFELRIETSAAIETSSENMMLEPGVPGASAIPVLGFVGSRIDRGEVLESGVLKIFFSSDSGLTVSPDANFEAWELVGPRGMRVVCLPGGGIAEWSDVN